ncbi:MAG: sodium:proton antiporter [Oscillospiraceae bacterium]|nr:sodium:proton antiporter [Oscillospiraceae bacterium]
MMEFAVLLVFALSLLLCLVLDISLLAALVFGFFLFCGYGLYRGHTLAAVGRMALSGIKTVKNILFLFVLIGMITAFWRASGTIAYIVYHATAVFSPATMLLSTFLLCSVLSVLTGTAFGTAATMGVICATIARSMGLDPILIGGAVLSGSYFGDRLSPMSTSALLVSTITGTDIYDNIRKMIPVSIVPALLSCVVYFFLGRSAHSAGSAAEICTLFEESFTLTPWLLLPALVIVVLSLCKVSVKITMSVSILLAAVLSAAVQGLSLTEILRMALLGYAPAEAALIPIMSGGGLLSMVNVFCIVCLSSTYAGIFKGTGLLNSIKHRLTALAETVTPYGSMLLTAIITVMISCNQTLAIMLTCELCDEMVADKTTRAAYLENTAVVIAPLVPWSIACAVPLHTVNAPALSIAAACYLYLLPIWNYILVLHGSRQRPVSH